MGLRLGPGMRLRRPGNEAKARPGNEAKARPGNDAREAVSQICFRNRNLPLKVKDTPLYRRSQGVHIRAVPWLLCLLINKNNVIMP